MSEEALNLLKIEKKFAMVSGTTYLFEERGTLDEVTRLATDWFLNHLTKTKNLKKSKKETTIGIQYLCDF